MGEMRSFVGMIKIATVMTEAESKLGSDPGASGAQSSDQPDSLHRLETVVAKMEKLPKDEQPGVGQNISHGK
eukprot:9832094-Karenia_brevis.AAC.1